MSRITEKQSNSTALVAGQPSKYVGCQWKVNVVLSTNYANKVLRPEVHLELYTAEDKKIRMTVPVDRLEEIRRQVA
jgi:hypothetical protein